MLASFPASIVNQNRSDLGILNRFNITPSRSSMISPDRMTLRLSARIPPIRAIQGRLGCLVAVPGKIEIDRPQLTFWAMMRSVRFNSPLRNFLQYL